MVNVLAKVFDNVKGTYDYLADRQLLREKVKRVLQDVFLKYGFAPVETPIVCKYDLLSSKYSEGADILKEMYKLSDQGQRELGLRYDLTITFAKLISSNRNIMLPYKRYEIGKAFRDGPVKLGRNREFTQCDIDCVGIKSVMAEAEYMVMTEEIYRKLGIDTEILFNNRKIMMGIIESVLGKQNDEKTRSIIMLIDKYEKISKNMLEEEFDNLGIGKEKVSELNQLLKCDYITLKEKIKGYPKNALIEAGFWEVDEMMGYLEKTRVYDKMTFAPYLARGIDIYTGVVWEIFLKKRKVADVEFSVSLGGGGRYDKIITQFIDDGKEYPAVGMSFGLDVICEVLNFINKDTRQSCVDVLIIPIGTQKESFEFANNLRKQGICVDIEKRMVRLKKSMDYANKMSIPFVVAIGEDEILSNRVFVRNMNKSENKEFAMNDLQNIVRYITEHK